MTGLIDLIKDHCDTYQRKTFTYPDVKYMCIGYEEMIYLEERNKIERVSVSGYTVEWKIV